MGVDTNAQNVESDKAYKGEMLPWDEDLLNKVPREKLGWAIKIEGEGPPIKHSESQLEIK